MGAGHATIGMAIEIMQVTTHNPSIPDRVPRTEWGMGMEGQKCLITCQDGKIITIK